MTIIRRIYVENDRSWDDDDAGDDVQQFTNKESYIDRFFQTLLSLGPHETLMVRRIVPLIRSSSLTQLRSTGCVIVSDGPCYKRTAIILNIGNVFIAMFIIYFVLDDVMPVLMTALYPRNDVNDVFL